MPSSAADEVVARRAALGRPLRFDEYVEIALYGEHGFYTTVGSAGRRGDFLTSAEVGPLFGAVVARWIEAEHRRLGEPPDFRVIEVGAGPGTLARAVLQAAPRFTDRYVAVEVSAALRARHPAGVESVARLPEDRRPGVVVANELLDNLPFRLAVFDGGWREAHVEPSRDGSLSEVLLPAPADWAPLPAAVPHGARAPIQQAASEWVAAARATLTGGRVLVFDYAVPTTSELALAPWRTWLRTYRDHERGEHYLRQVGRQDITVDVCLDQLPVPDSIRSQSQFLQRWGITDLVDEGRRVWSDTAHAPDLRSLRMRSREREAEALLDPAGLGGFMAVEWTVDAP